MIVKHERPPIWDRAIATFKFPPYAPYVFSWGDFIYDPNGAGVSADIQAHESIHSLQHKAMGGPEIWWDHYLVDARFRLEQEIEAYGAQYRYLKNMTNRKKAYARLEQITFDLSGPMYGSLVNYKEARRLIEEASMQDIRKKYEHPSA